MDRRKFLKKFLYSTTAAGLIAGSNITQARSLPDFGQVNTKKRGGRPDIVVIYTDQWNPRMTGYNGDPNVKTPHADSIAENGVNFSSCYTPCPVCMPARCSVISGLHPHSHNLWSNNSDFYMDPDISPMFRDIKDAGCFTAQIGKLHWTGGDKWKERFKTMQDYYAALGLDYCEDISTPYSTRVEGEHCRYEEHLAKLGLLKDYYNDMHERLLKNSYMVRPNVVKPEDHNDHFIADKGIELIKSIPKDVPFCTFISLPGPHPPLDAPGRYATMYDPEKIKLAPNVRKRYKFSEGKVDEKELRAMRANYYGKITMIDDCIGKVLDAVKNRGNYDNTLIMVISDHGEMLGAHGKMSKGTFWEESAKVPMIMQWPSKIKPGQTLDSPVSLLDVYATVVEAAGGDVTEGRNTKSLLPMAFGKTDRVRDAVFSEIGRKQHLTYMVRMDQYKWFLMFGREYLYDLKKDPWEMNNLIDDPEYKPIVQKLKQRHLKYFHENQLNLSRNYIPQVYRTRMKAEKE